MVILALDTVTRRGSLALRVGAVCHAREGASARTHGERLPGELIALLGEHGLGLRDVDVFAVIAGPGSFTGMRVGMAVVQGLALAGHRQVVAVPTLEAMVDAWRVGAGGAQPAEADVRIVVPCLDGQRGDVFFGAWAITGDQPVELGQALIEPSVGRPEDLVRRVEAVLTGAAAVIVGDGARRHAPVLAALGLPIDDVPGTLAEVAAAVAARRPEQATAPHALRPIYVRRPDAVLARERAGLPQS